MGEGLRSAVGVARLNGRELAGLLGWDPAKLSDLLNGKGGVTELEVAHLLGVYRTPAAERDHLLSLYREANAKGRWQQHGSRLPIQLRTLIDHENAATEIIGWHVNLLPGLLQTSEYMRAVILANPMVPGAEVVDQLHHLLRMSVRSYISVRVLPIAFGAHAGIAGSFTLMKFSGIQPVVFVETENSSLFVEDEAPVTGYRTVLAALDSASLDEEQSRGLITEIAL